MNIAEIAIALSAASPAEFTQLVAALVRVPDLLNAASSTSSNLTVFAPTDAAFSAFNSVKSFQAVVIYPAI